MSSPENGNSVPDSAVNTKGARGLSTGLPLIGALLLSAVYINGIVQVYSKASKASKAQESAELGLVRIQDLTEELLILKARLEDQFHPCNEAQKARVAEVRDNIVTNRILLSERLYVVSGASSITSQDIDVALTAAVSVDFFCATNLVTDNRKILVAKTIPFDDGAASFSLSPGFFSRSDGEVSLCEQVGTLVHEGIHAATGLDHTVIDGQLNVDDKIYELGDAAAAFCFDQVVYSQRQQLEALKKQLESAPPELSDR